MAEPLIVRIADLRTALVRVLDAAEKRLGPEIALGADYYWHVPVDDAFSMAEEPQEFTVGQVSDDLQEVMQDRGERLPEEAWHDLSHLVGVLRALELAARS